MIKTGKLVPFSFALLGPVTGDYSLGVSSDKVIDFMGIKSLSFLAGIGLLALAGITILFLFWLFMLIDCLKRDFRKDGDKIAWVIVIIFLQVFGALIYYFVVKVKNKKMPGKEKIR